MEAHALRVLEFLKVADILSGYAATAMGKRKAVELRPMDEPHTLRNALQETTELVAAMAEGYTLPLGAVEDARPAAERARVGGSPLEPAVLWRVSECLLTAGRLAGSLTRLGARYPALVSLGHSLPQCPELTQRIRSAIDAAGMVLDNASPELKDVRRRISTLRKKIESELRRLIENPDVRAVLQYPNPTITRDRYVLPVNAYRRHAVPGIVHGTSDSGATLYIEPMRIIEPGNELSETIAEEEEEVERVLWQLTRAVADRVRERGGRGGPHRRGGPGAGEGHDERGLRHVRARHQRGPRAGAARRPPPPAALPDAHRRRRHAARRGPAPREGGAAGPAPGPGLQHPDDHRPEHGRQDGRAEGHRPAAA